MALQTACKVLIVEDEGLVAQDVARRVQALGHQVVATVATAEEALEQAGQADIVLMDIFIDGEQDGIDAARRIRERHHVPVVFLTAHADRATLDRAKAAGPFGYLVKPLASASLQSSLELALHKHETERQLEEREAWLRTTVASTADAIIVTDERSNIRLMNAEAEKLTGWTVAEAHGRVLETVVRLVEEDTGANYGDPVPLAILKGSPMNLDRGLRLIARDGREREVEGTAAPVKSAPHTLGGVLVMRDVTLRRWEERQLRQAQRLEAAERLAARVSAEYATLIEAIRHQTDQLLRNFGEFTPAREAIEQIQRTAASAAHATRRLAAFGTRQMSNPEVLSLNGLLRQMTKLIESAVGSGITLQIGIAPGTGRIRADAAQLEQALLNLILHACSRMPEGGHIQVETGIRDAPFQGHLRSHAALSVTYDDPQADPARTLDPGGVDDSGLAVPLAQSIVTEHNGYLLARSSGGKTCLEILLPRIREESPPAARSIKAILLVDYRDRVRGLLHNFFEANGYNLIEAASTEEALTLGQLYEGAIDLLIASGADVDAILAELREVHPQLGTLRIVNQPAATPDSIQQPFTQEALLERVQTLLGAAAPAISSAAG